MADKPRFVVRLEGADLRPESTPIKDLIEFLSNLERAIKGMVDADTGESDADLGLSLVSIDEGSERLTWSIASLHLLRIVELTKYIKDGDFQTVSEGVLTPLGDIQKQAQKKGWSVHFEGSEETGVIDAAITPDQPIISTARSLISGGTTLIGRVIRVGGLNRPTALIQRPGAGGKTIDIESESLAKDLARLLYEEVQLDGVGAWRIGDWELVTFKAQSVSELPNQDAITTFQKLGAVSKIVWADVDAEAFVNELRGED